MALNLLRQNVLCSITKNIGMLTNACFYHGDLNNISKSPSMTLPSPALSHIYLPQYQNENNRGLQMKLESTTNEESLIPCIKDQGFIPQTFLNSDLLINRSARIIEYEIPSIHNIVPIKDPSMTSNVPLETAKSDIKWRKRRMRRHQLLRWRKKYPQIVAARLERKLENRENKRKEALEKSWKMYDLSEEPPLLSEEEKIKFQQEWKEEGVWTDALAIEEHANYEKVVSIMKQTDKK